MEGGKRNKAKNKMKTEKLTFLYFQVDMPVFFFIDPAFATDYTMRDVDLITLSYTFFPAKDGQALTNQKPQQNQLIPPQSTKTIAAQ